MRATVQELRSHGDIRPEHTSPEEPADKQYLPAHICGIFGTLGRSGFR